MDCRGRRLLACVVGLWLFSPSMGRGTDRVQLEPIGSFRTGIADGSATEVIAYHAGAKCLYAVNANNNEILIVSIADAKQPVQVRAVSMARYGRMPTSVAARLDVLAVSMLGTSPADRGRVVFVTPEGRDLGAVEVGWHPDLLMFTPDGSRLVVANEGEPSADAMHDGEGSISIVDVPSPLTERLTGVVVRDADLRAYDQGPLPDGVRAVDRSIPFSRDAEPEGVSIDAEGKLAYVSLQENSAIAVIDIDAARVTKLIGLGCKDFALDGNQIDASGKGQLDHMRNGPILGMYQPDNVLCFRVDGENYVALANEGDRRATDVYQEGIRLKDAPLEPTRFPQAEQLKSLDQCGQVMVSRTGDTDGDGDLDKLLAFGTRSMSIIRASDGCRVYDSGSQIERRVVERVAEHVQKHPNAPNPYDAPNGPEPEGLTTGEIDGRRYVFVGLERDSGIVTFDVTMPDRTELVGYVHPQQFEGHDVDASDDIGPEGLVFIPAKTSPSGKPLLAVANEVSGSITLYEVRVTR